MSEKIYINNSQPTRQRASGFLEKIGVKYYQYLAQKTGVSQVKEVPIDDLPADDILCTLAANITHFAAIIAFSVGALTTVVSVWFEWEYAQSMETIEYYIYYSLVVLSMLAIEMSVLFWLSLKTLHALVCLTGHQPHIHDEANLLKQEEKDTISNILARAALEIPDPVVYYLGIDPLKHAPKTKLFVISLLYKAKVILSGLVIKFLLIRVFGKGGSRLGFSWIAIPITGIWDAFVMYKVAKEARLRLFGHRLAYHIADHIIQPQLMGRLSAQAQEGAIRAIATTLVLSQNYHPNMLILMVKLCHAFKIETQASYDDWDDFLTLLKQVKPHERYFILDLLSISATFDGYLSPLEREFLPQAFGDDTEIYMARMEALTTALLSGRLHQAKALCEINFEAG